jgi:hypothetical protein
LGGQFQIKAPEPMRPACAELLTRINARLGLGHFDLDFNEGEIAFRTVVPVARRSRLRQSIIEDVIRGHHIIVNDFIPPHQRRALRCSDAREGSCRGG